MGACVPEGAYLEVDASLGAETGVVEQLRVAAFQRRRSRLISIDIRRDTPPRSPFPRSSRPPTVFAKVVSSFWPPPGASATARRYSSRYAPSRPRHRSFWPPPREGCRWAWLRTPGPAARKGGGRRPQPCPSTAEQWRRPPGGGQKDRVTCEHSGRSAGHPMHESILQGQL